MVFGHVVAGALFKHHLYAMAVEELQVWLQHMQVWKWVHIVAELHHVVPKENIVGKGSPVFYVFHKTFFGIVGGNGFLALTLDRAKHYVYVATWLDILRSIACVLVGQHRDGFIGKTLCHLVGKPQHGARLSAVDRIQFQAFGAGASVDIIVLTYRPYRGSRVFIHFFL